jgi:hypothetical protein
MSGTVGQAFNQAFAGANTVDTSGNGGDHPMGALSRYLESNFLGTPVSQWIFFTVTMMSVVVLWGMFMTDVKQKLGSV